VLILSMICWLPLLLLASFSGHLIAGVSDPFLYDPEVHIRLLVALPILIASEVVVDRRMRPIIAQFQVRGIIAPEDQPRFQGVIASAMRLRNSVIAEVVLLIFVSTVGYWVWSQKISLNVSSWYAVSTGGGLHWTAAGKYYAFVSLIVFRFILFRWYFRLMVWYRFLWQLRALPLHLNLYHPDRAGGLGFLSGSLPAFAPVFAAQAAVFSASIFAHILYARQGLLDFKMEIVVTILLFTFVTILPLTFFAVQLNQGGRTARREFGALASLYVDDFRQKWVLGEARGEESLLGTCPGSA
jgi:hypothetical protein